MNYVKCTLASALGAFKRLLGFAPPPPIRKRPRKALIVANLGGFPIELLREIDTYDTKKLTLRSACRPMRESLKIPDARLTSV